MTKLLQVSCDEGIYRHNVLRFRLIVCIPQEIRGRGCQAGIPGSPSQKKTLDVSDGRHDRGGDDRMPHPVRERSRAGWVNNSSSYRVQDDLY